jgi:hypothetical protein
MDAMRLDDAGMSCLFLKRYLMDMDTAKDSHIPL